MYNKLNSNYKKKHFYDFEDEPPEKKLISDGDILIKKLAEKQRVTKVHLEEQLSAKNQFYKSTEVISVTSYASGSKSLEEFNAILGHLNDSEKLKSHGLSREEIELFNDYKSGREVLQSKHKNINETVLNSQLEEIFKKIEQSENEDKKSDVNVDRLKTETTLATKPTSVETKLLKFALENQQKDKEKLPCPMDEIKDLEKQLVSNLSPVDIKKIRKKARSLSRQIDSLNYSVLKEPVMKNPKSDIAFSTMSKWDLKECKNDEKPTEKKVFSCKPQNYYTIKDGQIIKINSSDKLKNEQIEDTKKWTVEEIKTIPKFKNYDKGIPSKVLYIKNLASGIQEKDLQQILGEYAKYAKSFNILKGKMHGQAFIEFDDAEFAGKVLDLCNGTVLKNKPIVIQFGRRKCT